MILRLRGLPFTASTKDVVEFFAGFDVETVYLGNRNGKNTGEAYVELRSSAEAQKALQKKQHQHMGSRYIEIFLAGEADLLAQTTGGEGASPSLLGHVVRLRGLPFNSTAQDVVQFFKGVEMVGGEAGVVFTCTPDGRPTGEAYVELASGEALAAALARHKDKIGARYIEIFEARKGDMYQAVQQHGYFTTVGGRRRHHWHQQHTDGGAGQYPPDMGGGGGGGGGRRHSSQMDEMANAFAGFGLSQHDMQVPGPPRWGVYGTPGNQQYQQYMGGPPHQMQRVGMMAAGVVRWRPAAQIMPGATAAMQQPGCMLHFNPAPGPPPGKGGRGAVATGTRQAGGGSSAYGGIYGSEYGGLSGQAMVFTPFMMQHPLVMQHQHHASPWGTAGMMQQQGSAWYGGMQMRRAGPGMAQMGMGAAYTHFFPGYFPMRGGGSGQVSGGSHQQGQQRGGSRQQSQGGSYAGGSGGQGGTVAAAAAAAISGSQPAAQPLPAEGGGDVAGGAAIAVGVEEQPAAPPPGVQVEADEAATPSTPEQ